MPEYEPYQIELIACPMEIVFQNKCYRTTIPDNREVIIIIATITEIMIYILFVYKSIHI